MPGALSDIPVATTGNDGGLSDDGYSCLKRQIGIFAEVEAGPLIMGSSPQRQSR